MAIEPVTVKRAIELAQEAISTIEKFEHRNQCYAEILRLELYFTREKLTQEQKIKRWTDNAIWASLEIFVDAVLNNFENAP